jgi:uncharacterized protein (DUF362 family)
MDVRAALSTVSIAKIEGADYKKAIEDVLGLLGYSFDRKIHRVVIKPNLCYYWDHTTGQTTDPRFVSALVDVLREKTAVSDIALVESDASAVRCKYAYRFLGYEKLFKDHGVRLINLSEEKAQKVTVRCGELSHEFMVPELIREADLRINLPKIKYTIKGIELTCALKNIFGCNPYPLKFKYHPQLGNVIVALNKILKFDLVIIDSNIASGIQPCKLGLMMASEDPVAIDAAAAKIAGLNPGSIKYLKLASREGLGSMSFVTKGEPLNLFKAMYPKKTMKRKLMGYAYTWVVRLRLAKRLGLA